MRLGIVAVVRGEWRVVGFDWRYPREVMQDAGGGLLETRVSGTYKAVVERHGDNLPAVSAGVGGGRGIGRVCWLSNREFPNV